MSRARGVGALALALAGAALVGRAAAVHAADRPNEDEMFGGAAAKPAAPAASSARTDGGAPAGDGGATAGSADGGAPPPTPPAGPVSLQPEPSSPGQAGGQMPSRDDSLMGDPNGATKLSAETAPEDPLKIGGQLYLRALAQATAGQQPGDARLSAPALVDGYFDARPNDRVRGFVLGRLLFDPTLPTLPTSAASGGVMTGGGMTGAPSVPLLSGFQATRGPSVVLDQLWMRFDIKRTVFVTAGRQHVKWGTARFWTPTDFLHPVRRNPVAAFDARPGFTMVKLHLPWEERGWNFYGFGLVEGVRALDPRTGRPVEGSDAVSTLGQIGGALRAEVVLGTSEWGLGGVFYRDQKPRFGGDVSFGVGDFDLYVDAGFRYGSELPRRSYNAGEVPITRPGTAGEPAMVALTVDEWVDMKYPLTYSSGIKPQVTAGGTYSLRYNDNDVFTVTGEYFFNSRGYNDPHIYPGLFLSNTFEFFYTGRHYAALGAIAAAPWSWNYTTFSLTTLGNLSDQSFITRLDYSLTLLTHLRFEAFGAVNYGRRSGEFRLGVDGFVLPGGQTFTLQPQAFSLGLGLRISI